MQNEATRKRGKWIQQTMHMRAIIVVLAFLFAACSSSSGPTQKTLTQRPTEDAEARSMQAFPTATVHTQIKPGDWPSYLRDNVRSGFNSAEFSLNATTVADLKEYWAYHAQSTISTQPIVAFCMIYWGSWDGLEHATDLNGNQVWTTDLGKSHSCGITIGVASTAAAALVRIGRITASVIFVAGGNATFYALDAANGTIIWKTSLGSPPSHFIYSSPVVYKGSVYIGMASLGDCPAVQGQLIKMNAATGAIQHTFNIVPNGCIGGGLWSSPTVDEDTDDLYIASGSPDNCWTSEDYVSSLVELRALDLTMVSSWQVPKSEWVIDPDFGATPTLFTATIGGVSRQLVGAVHKNGMYYAFIRGAIENGPVWKTKVAQGGSCPDCGEGSISSSAWDGTRLYVAGGRTTINGATCKGSLQALNPATGDVLWTTCLSSGPVLAAVTAIPGIVVIEDGPKLLIMDADSGESLFTFEDPKRDSNFYGASSISNGMLYVGSTNGNLYAFGL